MPDINNLFQAGIENQQPAAAPEVTGEQALADLVGDGKKYANHEELAKAMIHSQHHIGTLETETATLREQSVKAQSVEDVLAAIKGVQPPAQEVVQDPAQQPASELSVADQIAAALQQRDDQSLASKADANRASVVAELNKTYGAEASQLYSKVGNDLGINLDELAGKSPAAVLKLVAEARPTPQQNLSQQLPAGTINREVADPNGVLNQKAINALYQSGKIKLAKKHELENQQLSALGATAFYN